MHIGIPRELKNHEYRVAQGAGVLGPEAFDPVPFMEKMAEYSFPYGIKDMNKETVA